MKTIFTLILTTLLLMLPAACAGSALPGGLQIIEEEAFIGAADIGEITLPEGISEIRSRAFADSGLTSINLPSSLTFIAEDAFSGCAAVDLTVPPNCPAWDWCMERGMRGPEWTSLRQTDSDSIALSWTAPEGVACSILTDSGGEWTVLASEAPGGEYCIDGLPLFGEYTFALEFSGTETVQSGESTFTFRYSFRTEAQTIAILNCDYSWWIQDGECILTEAKLWPDTATIEARIPSALGGCPVTRIGSKAFTCISGLTKVFIPESVEHIDSTAFYGCPDLTAVEMADSVTVIDAYAFAACPALTDVHLSAFIASIGDYAFWNCSALTEIDLPAALKTLGKKSLYGTGITSIALPDALIEIGAQAWNDNLSEIITGEQAASFRMVDGILYADSMSRLVWVPRGLEIAEYIAPETVTEIAPFAFAGFSSLKTASFPGGLTSIGESAFENCTSLENITALESLLTVGDSAFHGCALLTDDAFQSMTRLESVGARAFLDCTALENMPFPDTLNLLGASAFENCTALLSVSLGTEMSVIGNAAFYGCTALESVEMPLTLTEPEGFGSYMFYGCSNLKSCAVPAGVTKLDNYTFYECSGLTRLILPDGLKTIGNAVCFKCNALTGLVIPDSVVSIGSYAFTYCRALAEIDLPACTVGSYGFGACTSLGSVRFAESTSQNITLGNRSFYYCTALKAAYLPANVISIHAAAFESSAKVTLYVEENSAAHTFAMENGMNYELTA